MNPTSVVPVPAGTDPATVVAATQNAVLFTPNASIINIMGYNINLMSVLIIFIILGLLALFVRIQLSKKLDFADMITFDGKKVSLTKVIQLVGALTVTWVVIKMAILGTLTTEMVGIYLAYAAGVEGYAKFVAAKYSYSEKSIDQSKTDAINDQIDRTNNQIQNGAVEPPAEVPIGKTNEDPSIAAALADKATTLLDQGSAFADKTADLTESAKDVIEDIKEGISTVTGKPARKTPKAN